MGNYYLYIEIYRLCASFGGNLLFIANNYHSNYVSSNLNNRTNLKTYSKKWEIFNISFFSFAVFNALIV